ncbi:MAG: recombinase, partial [Ignavibacteria bacterium]
KSAHDAVREIYKYLNWGCVEVYDVDLEKYFDTVEHHKLMKLTFAAYRRQADTPRNKTLA